MDKLTNMKAFTRVVNHGSFSEAARELRLSRSAVSKYVIDLEIELGVQLLNRTTQSAAPTEVGMRYYERCLAILAEIEDAETSLSQFQVEARGLLRVNAPMSFGTMFLGRLIGQFMARHPDLQIQLVLSDQQLDTVQEGFDVTIRLTDSPPPNLVSHEIASAPRIICASPAYLEERGIPRHPRDLRDHAGLHYGYLETGAQWKLTGKDGDHWVPVSWCLCSNNGEVLRDIAVEGRGIALLPSFIVDSCLRDGTLREVLSDYHAPEMSIHAMFPPTRYLPYKLRVFIDFLMKSLSDGFNLPTGIMPEQGRSEHP
ncbi:LysR family transcriptional regulator [Labrys sp. KNU-23]|uniref:LysR family transcriptional regulator n=1 Tax=Labrys sp. KNU-23 TaxID=2789216 RepID=UPI0011EEEE8A|nr:LysR family transcriptional regulator [Labrys sp. KNU-23]QEN86077.1 LysR family transcriptional regulator [Labrys sp. KNU-23]